MIGVNTPKSLGGFDDLATITQQNPARVGFLLSYNTSVLCKNTSDQNIFYRSSITFECAKNLVRNLF